MMEKHLKRKPSPPVTAEMATKIRYLKKAKKLYQHQIAALLEINQGRVSEVLTGKRNPKALPPDQPMLPF